MFALKTPPNPDNMSKKMLDNHNIFLLLTKLIHKKKDEKHNIPHPFM
jgi:hypothetical protein